MIQLNDRQKTIAQYIKGKDAVAHQEISRFLSQTGESISRITLIRDLNILVGAGEIRQIGKGRSLKYEHSSKHPLLSTIDIEDYLSDTGRQLSETVLFNHDIFGSLSHIFSRSEIEILEKKNSLYRERLAGLPPTLIKKEFERIIIELSWKSSQIEGNTYTLFDTEILIKEHREAKGHSKEEAVMILNHKKALDYIFTNKERFRTISVREVENIHRLLVEDLEIGTGIRKRAVGITGSHYRPLDNSHQLTEVLEKTIQHINESDDPWTKAFLALIMISYIQPFEDGNKRTSRIVANACLIAYDICPLSLKSIDETEYKKAITIFYELQNASYIKKLFLEQFDFSIKNYFL